LIKKLAGVIFSMMLIFPGMVKAGGFGGDDSGTPGYWYSGETPSSIDPSKSPLVFVHGYNNSSAVWHEGNDMYEVALANGYETAFIDLHHDRDMWTNGAILAEKLQEMYHHFGGKKLVVIGYSKGGVDIQAALVHYHAHPYVSNVISLSSPHHGTQLADLAHSSAAWWLAALLGNNNEATESLQTGSMQYFRSITDSHQNAAKNRYYTLGGTKWGSFGSASYWGGLYLSQYGKSDGVVTAVNSRLPGASIVQEGSWNHTTIREGSHTFPVFRPYTTINQPAAVLSASASEAAAGKPRIHSIVKGGKAVSAISEEFSVEDNVNSITVSFLSEKNLSALKLISPDGKEYKTGKAYKEESDFFKGAWIHQFEIGYPEAGSWLLKAPANASYLYTVTLNSPLNDKIQGKSAKSHKAYKTKWIRFGFDSSGKKLQQKAKGEKPGLMTDSDFSQEGVYNVTTEIKGLTENGKPYERTLIESFYIDQNGKRHN
jgi:triacylglycerol esterase/lipase EstA (alpha/beta hydrolase family)